jgi:hypothetical protein
MTDKVDETVEENKPLTLDMITDPTNGWTKYKNLDRRERPQWCKLEILAHVDQNVANLFPM